MRGSRHIGCDLALRVNRFAPLRNALCRALACAAGAAHLYKPHGAGAGNTASSPTVIGSVRSCSPCARSAQRGATCAGIATRYLPAAVVVGNTARGRGRAIRGAPLHQTVLQLLMSTGLGQGAVHAVRRQDARAGRLPSIEPTPCRKAVSGRPAGSSHPRGDSA